MTWTAEQDAALLAMRRADMTPAETAAVTGIEPDEIQARIVWLMLPKHHARSA